MEKIIDAALGLIEALVIGSAIGFGGMKAVEVMHVVFTYYLPL